MAVGASLIAGPPGVQVGDATDDSFVLVESSSLGERERAALHEELERKNQELEALRSGLAVARATVAGLREELARAGDELEELREPKVGSNADGRVLALAPPAPAASCVAASPAPLGVFIVGWYVAALLGGYAAGGLLRAGVAGPAPAVTPRPPAGLLDVRRATLEECKDLIPRIRVFEAADARPATASGTAGAPSSSSSSRYPPLAPSHRAAPQWTWGAMDTDGSLDRLPPGKSAGRGYTQWPRRAKHLALRANASAPALPDAQPAEAKSDPASVLVRDLQQRLAECELESTFWFEKWIESY